MQRDASERKREFSFLFALKLLHQEWFSYSPSLAFVLPLRMDDLRYAAEGCEAMECATDRLLCAPLLARERP